MLAAVGTLAMDARKRANRDWPRFAAATSHVPFVAIAQAEPSTGARLVGAAGHRPAAFALFFLAHPWLFGARPY